MTRLAHAGCAREEQEQDGGGQKVSRATRRSSAVVAAFGLGTVRKANAQSDPLSSWSSGAGKQAILDFVHATTNQVSPEDRVATFDQDGTLWVEHPVYAQAMFAIERLHALAPKHPQWTEREPYKSVLTNDTAAMAKFSERDWAEIVFVTHVGMSQAEFVDVARQWLATAKHPRFNRPYTDLVYQPMREVMEYLRANGFKTYIVTGGGQDFVRAYAQKVYGMQPEQVVGSSIVTKYEIRNGKPELIRLPKLFFDDDHAG